MKMTPLRSPRSLLVMGVMMCCTAAWAAKPGGGGGAGGTTFDPDAFVWRPDLGGWLDTTSNLVWGYSIYGVSGSNSSYAGAGLLASSYPSLLASQVDWYQDQAAYYETRGDEETAAGNLTLAAQYYALADAYLDDAAAFEQAALEAGQYNNWRVPTLSEAQTVMARGLFSTGPDGLNGWTRSPADDQLTPVVAAWTSTSATSKLAWSYAPTTGGSSKIGVTSSIDAIVVRTHTP